MRIDRPTLMLDEQKCRTNIRRMAQKAKKSNVIFRPHFKTHQSAEVGEWFRDEGVTKITVSSVTMAEYFANASWQDILIAFPVNILEIEQINRLAQKVNLSLLLESTELAEYISENLNHKVGIYLKIDTGYHRTGIISENTDKIQKVLNCILNSSKLFFVGFLTHSGNTYAAKSKDEIILIHRESVTRLRDLSNNFKNNRLNPLVSIGDTPSCSIATDYTGVDEIRPGNFAFYDVMQFQLGVCDIKDIAVCLACPVVAIHPDRNEIVIYGGAIHLSKDFITDSNGNMTFGMVVKLSDKGWSEPLPGTFLKALTQEHGVISSTNEILSEIKPGDIIGILPIHSCLTAQQMRYYLTLDGRQIKTMNS